MKRRRHAASDSRDRGSVAVEFALLLPVLLLLIFGIIDFGRAINDQITLTQAAREGARLASLGYSTSAVTTRAQSAATGLSPVTVTVTTSLPGRRRDGRGRGGEGHLYLHVRHPGRGVRGDVRHRELRVDPLAHRHGGDAVRDLIRGLARPALRLLRRDERGVVAVLVGLLIGGVLLGLGALVIDVGQLYQERAQLQNGADAAAIAVAKSCIYTTCTASGALSTAVTYAGENAAGRRGRGRARCAARAPSAPARRAPAR